MKMLRFVALAASAAVFACSNGSGNSDAGTDGGGDAGCASPVSGGASCSTPGATACGLAPVCTDVSGATTTCTCTGGTWDCGKCPACGSVVVLGGQCGVGQVCTGPTIAKQCDGTTVQVSGDCHCGNGWECSGVTALSCVDAGADAASDASGD